MILAPWQAQLARGGFWGAGMVHFRRVSVGDGLRTVQIAAQTRRKLLLLVGKLLFGREPPGFRGGIIGDHGNGRNHGNHGNRDNHAFAASRPPAYGNQYNPMEYDGNQWDSVDYHGNQWNPSPGKPRLGQASLAEPSLR